MIGEMIGNFFSEFGQTILNALQTVLFNVVWSLLYAVDIACVGLTNVAYKLFRVFAGLDTVEYADGGFKNRDALINVLLRNGSINSVYWDVAIIGVALCFGFGIIAIIKKMADLEDKNQRSVGHILFNVGKSILLMLLMTAIVTTTIKFSNVLLGSIDAAFNHAAGADEDNDITFNEEEYAAMARVLNTIGNYSLNTAYSSRYNVNSCYNKIRTDMQWLEADGVFDFDYYVVNSTGRPVESWQSALLKIYRASGDLRQDIAMDYYNENLSRAIVNAMELIRKDASFKPLTYYKSTKTFSDMMNTPFDVLMFMTGTGRAANNPAYNENPSISDSVRSPYFTGEKSIYSLSKVMEDFTISPIGTPRMQHLVIILTCFLVFKDLLVCLFNAIARMFNLILLYLMAPLAISVTPLDDGGKFKQWSTAFVIQCFGILGSVVSMRLFLLFVPLIFSGSITFFPNGFHNFMAQVVFLIGGAEVMKKSNGIITGILADNAGMQSIMAGDMSSTADKTAGVLGTATMGVAGIAADLTGATALKNKAVEGWNGLAQGGGIPGKLLSKVFGGGGGGDGAGAGAGGGGGGGGGGGASGDGKTDDGKTDGQNHSQMGSKDTPNTGVTTPTQKTPATGTGTGTGTPVTGTEKVTDTNKPTKKNLNKEGTLDPGNNDVVKLDGGDENKKKSDFENVFGKERPGGNDVVKLDVGDEDKKNSNFEKVFGKKKADYYANRNNNGEGDKKTDVSDPNVVKQGGEKQENIANQKNLNNVGQGEQGQEQPGEKLNSQQQYEMLSQQKQQMQQELQKLEQEEQIQNLNGQGSVE